MGSLGVIDLSTVTPTPASPPHNATGKTNNYYYYYDA